MKMKTSSSGENIHRPLTKFARWLRRYYRCHCLFVAIQLAVRLLGLLETPCAAADFSIGMPGERTSAEKSHSFNLPQLIFLNQDEVVIAVNRQGPATSLSPVFVLDIPSRRIRARSRFSTNSMNWNPIGRIDDHKFAMSSAEGLLSCTDNLECTKTSDKAGQVFVSPAGKKLVLRDLRLGHFLFDTISWRLLESLPAETNTGPRGHLFHLYPGDSSSVLQDNETATVLRDDNSRAALSGFSANGAAGCCWYLGGQLVTVLSLQPSMLITFDLTGRELYRIPLADPFHTDVVPSCCGGNRFALAESSYSFWNSVTNFMDINNTRQRNVFHLSIFNASTGHLIGESQWDPRPGGAVHLALPQTGIWFR